MNIDFTCAKCDGSFELDSQDIVDGTEKLECPHCDAKATQVAVDEFNAAITEMLAQVAAMSKKFAVAFAIDSEDVDVPVDEDDDEDEEEEEDLDDEDEDDEDEEEDDVEEEKE
ncbi:MAG: Asparagine-rich protein [Myxococcaceae bacterium]|nr:Asparagine-rich protein [Myxococcaceae bacterium]